VLGLDPAAPGLVAWDVYDAVLTPGDVIATMSWRTHADATAAAGHAASPDGSRYRTVRIICDYGKYNRRESPQYYPDVRR